MDGLATTFEESAAGRRGVLASYVAVTPTQADKIAELETEIAELRTQKIEASRLTLSPAVVYVIVSTALALVGMITALDSSRKAENAETKVALHDMQIKLDAKEKVDTADQRTKDVKDQNTAQWIDRVDKAQQMDRAYIVVLQNQQKGSSK